MRELHISKTNIRDTRFALVKQAPGWRRTSAAQARSLRAHASNNVTYAAMGEGMLGYWDFFPASESFGKVPVWGFATVTESNTPDVPVGARYYGYYPLAESLDVTPRKTATGLCRHSGAPRAESRALQRLHRHRRRSRLRCGYEAEQYALSPALRHRLVGG